MSAYPSDSSVFITLSKETVLSALEMARTTQNHYEGNVGHYGSNSIDKHFIGKLGENAVSLLLNRGGIKVVDEFSKIDRRSRSDLIVRLDRNRISIEVKTFNQDGWKQYGRVIACSQEKRIVANSDFIFWCCVKDPRGDQEVQVKVMGYSTVLDLQDTTLRQKPYKENTIQLSEVSIRHLRNFADDAKALTELKKKTAVADREVFRARLAGQADSINGGKYLEMLREAGKLERVSANDSVLAFGIHGSSHRQTAGSTPASYQPTRKAWVDDHPTKPRGQSSAAANLYSIEETRRNDNDCILSLLLDFPDLHRKL